MVRKYYVDDTGNANVFDVVGGGGDGNDGGDGNNKDNNEYDANDNGNVDVVADFGDGDEDDEAY